MRLDEIRGCAIGFRKSNQRQGRTATGSWILRVRRNGAYTESSFATASDEEWLPANGSTILDYFQARSRAHKLFIQNLSSRKFEGKIVSVGDAMEDYIADRERRGLDISDVTYRVRAHIAPALGQTLLSELSTPILEKFLHDTANRPPIRRSAMYTHEPQYARDVDMADPATRRKRQASANRIWSDLRAALNCAYRAGWTDTRAWTRVQTFRSTDAARQGFFSLEDCGRLLAACAVDFRDLVHAALVTGCRYGELCALRVSNFDRTAGTVHVSTSKTGRARDVTLSDEGRALFIRLSRMKLPEAQMLAKADGRPWGKSEQSRQMMAACANADLAPMGFHQLRHTHASLMIMNGVRMLVVAQNLGHRDTRMVERYYGHLSDSYKAEMIRSRAPVFAQSQR